MSGFLKKSTRLREVDTEFRRKIVTENSKWAIILLIIVALTQVVTIAIEAIGLLPWSSEVFIFRIAVIAVSSILTTLLVISRKNKELHRYLVFIMVLLNIIALVAGGFFIIYFISEGNFSFTVYLLVVYVLSLSYVFRPCILAVLHSLFFVFLVIHLSTNLNLNSVYIGEIISASIFLLVMAVGSILNYMRYKMMYRQEKKIQEINEKLEMATQTDVLTGLYNRRKAMDELEKQFDLAKRYKTMFTVGMLDIDHFKRINDNYGHNTGDAVLREFSGIMQAKLRTSDFIGRWGGEEFILILPHTKPADAIGLFERLQADIRNHLFADSINVAFSAGLCGYSNDSNIGKIINCADKALYIAKEKGRDRTEIFDKSSAVDKSSVG